MRHWFSSALLGIANPSPTPPLEREGLDTPTDKSPSPHRGGVGEGFSTPESLSKDTTRD